MTTITTTYQLRAPWMLANGNPLYAASGELMHFAETWDDISSDVLAAKQLRHGRGIYGILPTSCVASPGSFNFSLKNGPTASDGVGYYSPNHSNIRIGFEKGSEIRVKYVYSGTTKYHWRGRIFDITPSPDPKKPHVDVIAFDLMREFSEQKFKATDVGTDQRGDQALTTMIGILPRSKQPVETSFGTGKSTFPIVFDSERDEKTTVAAVMQKIAQSEAGGKIYINSGTLGEQLVFANRHYDVTETVVQYDFDNSISDIAVDYSSDLTKTVVQVIIHPREIDDSDVVLGQVQKSFSIGGGASRDITLLFRDPNGSARISVDSLAARVSGTDFVASANEDGTGSDLTSEMTVTEKSRSANSITLTVANTGDLLFWVQTLQQKGTGIYLFDPLIYESRSDPDDLLRLGERTLRFDMAYEDDYNQAANVADYFLEIWQGMTPNVTGLVYYPERSASLAQAFVDIDIGKRVTVNLPQINIDQDYFVQHIEIAKKDGLIQCIYGLVPADSSAWLVLNDSIYGELDSSYARLAL